MGSDDEPATHPALQRADEAIARIAAMTPEEIADYIQGGVDEDESGMDVISDCRKRLHD